MRVRRPGKDLGVKAVHELYQVFSGKGPLKRSCRLCAAAFPALPLGSMNLLSVDSMSMIRFRVRQRRVRARIVASMVLAGIVALACTPVCGSVLDVDPVACCEHHACGQSPKSCRGARHVQPTHAGCWSMFEGVSDTDSGAARCCELGALNHPNAKLQSFASATHVLNAVAALTLPSLAPPPALSHGFYSETPLKIPSIPLYTLTATYRT